MSDFLAIPGVLQLIGTLGGFALGTLTTWLTLRSQYKLKSIELSSQSRLKGKELLFGAYQSRIVSIRERGNEIGSAFSKLVPLAQSAKTDDEKRQVTDAFLTILTEGIAAQKEWFRELQEEIKEVGLEDKAVEQTARIREALINQPAQVTTEAEIMRLVVGWAKAVGLMDSLRQDVLTRRCENLFRGEIETLPQTKG